MKRNEIKKTPSFKNEEEEREFWAKHDASEYFDFSKSSDVSFPNLKQTTKAVSIRLPESMLNELKLKAHKRDVPYQSLIKMVLYDWIRRGGSQK